MKNKRKVMQEQILTRFNKIRRKKTPKRPNNKHVMVK